MNNLAKNMEPSTPCLEYGQVLMEEAGRFIVEGIYGPDPGGKRAAGCLLQPRAGDRVLFTTDGQDEAYILSVLKRSEGQAASNRLVFDGPVDLEVKHGGLRLTADTDLSLASGRKMALASREDHSACEQGRSRYRKAFPGIQGFPGPGQTHPDGGEHGGPDRPPADPAPAGLLSLR